jgi:hypothetical protein
LRRQPLNDEPRQAFRLRLACGAVAKLRDQYAEAHTVPACRYAITPPEGIIGTDIDGNGLRVDPVLLERLLKILEELASIARTAGPVHGA